MKKTYLNHGTCSSSIDLDVSDGVIRSVAFNGGCDGNLQGICTLVTGMDARDAVRKLKGIRCGSKATSCPDQLARALEKALAEQS